MLIEDRQQQEHATVSPARDISAHPPLRDFLTGIERLPEIQQVALRFLPIAFGIIGVLMASTLALHQFYELTYLPLVRLSHAIALLVCVCGFMALMIRRVTPLQAIHWQNTLAGMLVLQQVILFHQDPIPAQLIPHGLMNIALAAVLFSRRWFTLCMLVLHLNFVWVMSGQGFSQEWTYGVLGISASLAVAILVHISRDALIRQNLALRDAADAGREAAERSIAALETEIHNNKQLHRQLVEHERTAGTALLAGGIAHSLNNLLVPILGNAELMLLASQDKEQKKQIESILEASKRAKLLGGELLAIAGSTDATPTQASLNKELASIASLFNSTLESNLHLEFNPAITDLHAEIESGGFQQAILNILTNARDAMPFGGNIELSMERRTLTSQQASAMRPALKRAGGLYACITVQDAGDGMSDEALRRAFEPFFSEKLYGKGLGLSSVLRFAERNGGAISFTSELGVGTQVSLYLPECSAIQVEEPLPPAAPSEMPQHGTHHVLVVDDDAAVREVIGSCLQTMHLLAEHAEDGGTALAKIRQDPDRYSLVILDLRMPGLSGFETLEAMRSLVPSLPVIVCSGFEDPGDQLHSLDLRDVQFLNKPFTFADLRDSVLRSQSSTKVA